METKKRGPAKKYEHYVPIRIGEGQMNVLHVLTTNVSAFIRIAIQNEIKRITKEEACKL
jgi:hypothetical protein